MLYRRRHFAVRNSKTFEEVIDQRSSKVAGEPAPVTSQPLRIVRYIVKNQRPLLMKRVTLLFTTIV